MELAIEFPLTSSRVSDVSRPSDDGSVPDRPSDARDTEVTNPPLHVTPLHAAMLPEHTAPVPPRGVRPEQVQPDTELELPTFKAAARSHNTESCDNTSEGMTVGDAVGRVDGLLVGVLLG